MHPVKLEWRQSQSWSQHFQAKVRVKSWGHLKFVDSTALIHTTDLVVNPILLSLYCAQLGCAPAHG